MTRPSGFPALSIAPAALADKLHAALPHWAMGLEEPGLARHLAATACGAADPDIVACGAGLALWSWQRAPLDAARAALLAGPLAASPSGRMAAVLAPLLSGGPDPAELGLLLSEGRAGDILRILLPRLRDARSALAWLAPAWDGLTRQPTADLALAALDVCPWPRLLGGGAACLRARLLAELLVLHAAPAEALTALDALDAADPEGVFAAWAAYLRAELLLRLGEAEAGTVLLAGCFKALPWHTHLGLKLHGLLRPRPEARPEAASRAVILVYSWNKAELTRQTLASLARTDMGGARVLALDNGSADGTGEAMEASAGLFAPGTMRVIVCR
jgi:hypothetical protein